MTSHQRDLYDAAISNAPSWVAQKVLRNLPPSKSEATQLNAFLTAARQIGNTTAGYDTYHTPEQPKIDAAVQHLQQMLEKNPNGKAVVYSNYLGSGINPYKAKLDALKIPYGEFTGEMNHQERDQLVKDSNANKLRALLLSRAGGEGLDLKGTRLIQLLDPHWNSSLGSQVIGRGIRYKSHDDLPVEDRQVAVQHFLATRPRSSISERLHLSKPGHSADEYLRSLSEKKETLNQQFRDLYQKD
jgi:SNF2 family DNA or RNA helicase